MLAESGKKSITGFRHKKIVVKFSQIRTIDIGRNALVGSLQKKTNSPTKEVIMSGLVLRTSSADFPSDFLYANAARLLNYFNQASTDGSIRPRGRGLHSLTTSSFPKVNFGVIKKGNTYTKFVMDVALAGYNPDDITVEIDKKDRTITIEGMPMVSVEADAGGEEKEEYIEIDHEIKQSNFRRTFTAPDRADLDNITHKYEEGILTLEIPIVDSAPHITKLKLK